MSAPTTNSRAVADPDMAGRSDRELLYLALAALHEAQAVQRGAGAHQHRVAKGGWP